MEILGGSWLRSELGLKGRIWYAQNGVNMIPFNNGFIYDDCYKELQKSRLKILLSQKQEQVDKMNNFLNYFKGIGEDGKSYDMFADLVSIVGEAMEGGSRASGFVSGRGKNRGQTQKYEDWTNRLTSAVNDINQIIHSINPNGSISIPTDFMESIGQIESLTKIDKENIRTLRYEYIEQVVQEAMAAAGFDSFNTSLWTTGALGELAGGQMIQDAIGMLNSSINGKLTSNGAFTITFNASNFQKDGMSINDTKKVVQDFITNQKLGKTKKITKSKRTRQGEKTDVYIAEIQPINITDFLKAASITSGSNTKIEGKVTIGLDNSLYDEITKASLNIQAKSGKQQHLFNDNVRNKVSLNSYDGALQLLTQFFNTYGRDGSSIEFDPYVNYIFSKNFDKFFAIKSNEFYLTDRGFATMDEIMEKNNFYYRLLPIANNLSTIAADSYTIVEEQE